MGWQVTCFSRPSVTADQRSHTDAATPHPTTPAAATSEKDGLLHGDINLHRVSEPCVAGTRVPIFIKVLPAGRSGATDSVKRQQPVQRYRAE